MISISISPDIDRSPWYEDQNIPFGEVSKIGLLRNGTVEGNATVALVVTLTSGEKIGAQTTWRLFRGAFRALEASPIIAEEIS